MSEEKVEYTTGNPTPEQVAELRKATKAREKEEAEAKKYWNTMITRKEAYQMVQETYGNLIQQQQLLMVQNTTLLEILAQKGVATAEEINEHSKKVIESMFGPVPTKEGEVDTHVATTDSE